MDSRVTRAKKKRSGAEIPRHLKTGLKSSEKTAYQWTKPHKAKPTSRQVLPGAPRDHLTAKANRTTLVRGTAAPLSSPADQSSQSGRPHPRHQELREAGALGQERRGKGMHEDHSE